MATDKQIAANRRNALRSTCPRTPLGKSRSRANSLRYGILSKVMAAPALVADAQKLAIKVAREHGKPDDCVEAQTVADAEQIILQLRAVRARLLDRSSPEHVPSSQANDARCSGDDGIPVIAKAGDNDLGSAYLTRLPALSRIDRHEKTALLRRQRALRSLCLSK
jgi:hypothetical protein